MKKWPIEIVPEWTQLLDLLGKHFTSAIMNMFKEWKEIMSRKIKMKDEGYFLPNKEYQ